MTYFQKMGLNAIDSAHTGKKKRDDQYQSKIHMRGNEMGKSIRSENDDGNEYISKRAATDPQNP